MKHSDFKIGMLFKCFNEGDEWRVTDIGTRTIIAIKMDPNKDSSWYRGPPYAVEEAVFDEYDIEACQPLVNDVA